MSFVNDVMAGLGDRGGRKNLSFFEDQFISSNLETQNSKRKKAKTKSIWNIFVLFCMATFFVWFFDQNYEINFFEEINSTSDSIAKTNSKIDPQSIDEHIDQAHVLIQQGENTSAHKILRQILVLDNNHLQARLLLASSLIKKDQKRDAIKLYTQGFKIAPKEPNIAVPLAELLVQEGKIDLAIRVLKRAAPTSKIDPEYYSLIAALQQKMGHHAKAINTYEYVLKERPDNKEWWLALGISYLAEEQNKQALSAFEKSLHDQTISMPLELFAQLRVKELKQRLTSSL